MKKRRPEKPVIVDRSGFDPDILRPMLIEANGDVRSVARSIGADSEELRTFILNTPLLMRALEEVIACGVDQSLSVLFEGLEHKNYVNRLAAAKEFLKTRPAQKRGFHHSGDLTLKVPGRQGGALTLTWLPPEPPKGEPKLIEGRKEE